MAGARLETVFDGPASWWTQVLCIRVCLCRYSCVCVYMYVCTYSALDQSLTAMLLGGLTRSLYSCVCLCVCVSVSVSVSVCACVSV